MNENGMLAIDRPAGRCSVTNSTKAPAQNLSQWALQTAEYAGNVKEKVPRHTNSSGNNKDPGKGLTKIHKEYSDAVIPVVPTPFQSHVASLGAGKTASNAIDVDETSSRMNRRAIMVPEMMYGGESSIHGCSLLQKRNFVAANVETMGGTHNRVSKLEAQVRPLQVQSAMGNDDALVEDPSVEAMKAAMATLERATGDFARSRDYDTARISRDIEAIWAQLKPGEDGDGAAATNPNAVLPSP